jgi:hypothetical protein
MVDFHARNMFRGFWEPSQLDTILMHLPIIATPQELGSDLAKTRYFLTQGFQYFLNPFHGLHASIAVY